MLEGIGQSVGAVFVAGMIYFAKVIIQTWREHRNMHNYATRGTWRRLRRCQRKGHIPPHQWVSPEWLNIPYMSDSKAYWGYVPQGAVDQDGNHLPPDRCKPCTFVWVLRTVLLFKMQGIRAEDEAHNYLVRKKEGDTDSRLEP